MERRVACEWRAAGERRLIGYASVWDDVADLGDFKEIVRRGAFEKSLAGGTDILALVDHEPSKLLGRSRTQTLKLIEDERGLAFDLRVPDTTLGRDILALAERRDLGGMSIGFRLPPDGARWNGRMRELVAIDLVEVSVATAWPAYNATSITARTAASDANAVRRLLYRAGVL